MYITVQFAFNYTVCNLSFLNSDFRKTYFGHSDKIV